MTLNELQWWIRRRRCPPGHIVRSFDVKGLSTKAEHLRRGGPVLARQLQRRLDAQTFDKIRRFAHEIFHRHPSHKLSELLNGARQFSTAEPFASPRQPAARIVRPKTGADPPTADAATISMSSTVPSSPRRLWRNAGRFRAREGWRRGRRPRRQGGRSIARSFRPSPEAPRSPERDQGTPRSPSKFAIRRRATTKASGIDFDQA